MGSKLIQPLTEEEIRKTGVANVRKAYAKLATVYNRIIDGNVCYCHMCNEFHNPDLFYNDKRYSYISL